MKTPELIVALDLPSSSAASAFISKLSPAVNWYKVGLELFTAEGPSALAPLKAMEKKIFLDLKLHDIPNTVSRAIRAAAAHNVSLLTVHALGGEAMLRAAAETARSLGPGAPKIIAVTILTSHSQADLAALGIQRPVSGQALALADLALKCGADGLVASVNEAQILRQNFGKDFILVVPGIRPAGAAVHDQKRVATPALAVAAGADFLVVGRPILEAQDPAIAAKTILKEMRKARSQKPVVSSQ